jgi:hypothetical protein
VPPAAARTALAIVTTSIALPTMGQWLELPTPGLPRTADGKPDLTAPAPRLPDNKPDFAGIWHRSSTRYYDNIAVDLESADVLPWAERDLGHLDLDVTFEDPGAYASPWTVSVPLELFSDTELLEHVCNENEKSTVHMTSSLAGAAEFVVARETLERYAGTNEIPGDDGARSAVVSIAADGLFLDLDRTGPAHLVPMSETDFSPSRTVVHFAADGEGAITQLVIQTVEGQDTAIRKT